MVKVLSAVDYGSLSDWVERELSRIFPELEMEIDRRQGGVLLCSGEKSSTLKMTIQPEGARGFLSDDCVPPSIVIKLWEAAYLERAKQFAELYEAQIGRDVLIWCRF